MHEANVLADCIPCHASFHRDQYRLASSGLSICIVPQAQTSLRRLDLNKQFKEKIREESLLG